MNIFPYFVTAASIIGTVANSLQKRWCFYIWLCTNAFWCVYNAANGSYAQAALYAFNFAMAVLGLIKWRRNSESGILDQIKGLFGIHSHSTRNQEGETDCDHHAHWIIERHASYSTFICSACGFIFNDADPDTDPVVDCILNHCPHCGAIMDGKENKNAAD